MLANSAKLFLLKMLIDSTNCLGNEPSDDQRHLLDVLVLLGVSLTDHPNAGDDTARLLLHCIKIDVARQRRAETEWCEVVVSGLKSGPDGPSEVTRLCSRHASLNYVSWKERRATIHDLLVAILSICVPLDSLVGGPAIYETLRPSYPS